MAQDPNLVSDTCVLMNDGAAPNWWLSDDVKLTNPTGVAVPGTMNGVQITARRAMQNCTLPAGSSFVRVELYVCNPTGSPFTTTSSQVKQILDSAGGAPGEINLTLANLNTPRTIQWDLPALGAGSHPAETAGHKCLIARARPNNLAANADLGFVVDDQHYAQRNICIQTCSSPCGLDLWTENPEKEGRIKNVVFRLELDLKPTEQLLQLALPLLKTVPEFRQVATRPPNKGFALELPDFPDAKLTDRSRTPPEPGDGCAASINRILNPKSAPAASAPTFEAQVQVQPGQLSFYKFVTDLDGSERGDAHIFHLTHNQDGRALSGLTILLVKV